MKKFESETYISALINLYPRKFQYIRDFEILSAKIKIYPRFSTYIRETNFCDFPIKKACKSIIRFTRFSYHYIFSGADTPISTKAFFNVC